MAKKTFINYVTPAFKAIWPKLIEADEYKGKLSYSVRGSFSPEEMQPLQALLDKAIEEYKETEDFDKFVKALNKKEKEPELFKAFQKELDKEADDEPTGRYLANFKMNEEKTDRSGKVKKQRPGLFDSARNPFPLTDRNGTPSDIWGGSTVKVAGFITAWSNTATREYGASFKMQSVQIIDLVRSGGQSAAAFDVEDGYVVEAEPQFPSEVKNESDPDDAPDY